MRSPLTAVLAALLGTAAIIPSGAGAQGTGSCATANAPAADSVTLLVSAVVEAYDARQGVSPEYAERATAAITAALAIPTPLGMVAYIGHRLAGDDAVHVTGAHLDLDAMYGITLRRNGRVKRTRVLTTSLNPALDSAVLAAVHTADSTRALPPLPEGATGDTIALRLLVTASDSARARGTPILRARIPLRHLDRQLEPLRPEHYPRYPDALRLARVEGRVDLSFVVDGTGAVIPGTISVRRATNEEFARAVLAVFPTYRFVPAVVDGCAVPFHGAMPFDFSSGN